MTRRVVVSVTDERLGSMTEVAAALERAGMRVDTVHPLLGTVSGRCDDNAVANLRDVPGVAAVEPERDVGTR